jgi:two-component system OmpR family response regulator
MASREDDPTTEAREQATLTVLVVDDDPRLREVAVWALEEEGIVVDTARDRRQAAERVRQRQPALVVLDMSLPPDQGDSVAAELRAACGPQLPILLITADGKASETARRVGAFAYLQKPFDIEQLVLRVRERLAT